MPAATEKMFLFDLLEDLTNGLALGVLSMSCSCSSPPDRFT